MQIDKILFIILVLVLPASSIIGQYKNVADLTIISFEPLKFNLTFASPVTLPAFQLLLNQIPIDFSVKFVNNANFSNSFIINGFTEGIVDTRKLMTQKYTLMFIEPLQIDNGNLAMSSFLLRAHLSRDKVKYINQSINQKSSLFRYQNWSNQLNIMAIIICTLTYILAYTTLIGLTTYSFVSYFVYYSLQSSYFTALDYRIAFYLLFQANQVEDITNELLYMLIPHILIIFSYLVGIISRFCLQQKSKRSAIWNYVYYYLSYKFFIITWQIMYVPIFANSIHLVRQFNSNTLKANKFLAGLYIYYSVALMLFYIYFCYFGANPQIGQSEQKWVAYTKSDHYKHFDALHFGVNIKSCRTRSFKFIVAILRLIFLVCISTQIASISNIILQIIFLIYIFTLRPFSFDIFNILNFSLQVLAIVNYIYRYIAQVYVEISPDVTTSADLSNLLLTNLIFASFIIFLYIFLAVLQLINKIRHLRNGLRELDLKLKGKQSQPKSQIGFKNQKTTEDKHKIEKQGKSQGMKLAQNSKKSKQTAAKQIETKKNQKKMEQQLKRSACSSKSSSSPKKDSWNSKLKQKSSLLQSISLQVENSPQN